MQRVGGVVVNSFEELEKSHIPAFESFYINGAKAWCLGPLCLYGKMGSNKSTNQNHSCTSTQWLAEQVTPDSVIYVSFGTQADVSDSQLDEVAFALEESGFPFYGWQDICEGVEELMGGSRGRSARERVQALGRVARRAVQKGGSSHDTLNKLIDKLRVSM
ncbi:GLYCOSYLTRANSFERASE [Salix koriyanagi]|uniref:GLYCOSYLTRANSFERASE n=1 Tax=Salix koriyanagi TaxID=2511006 RepID=A0A9Q0W2B4_9ROSI|nr:GLYCOSYLTRANSFERASE [Salix koriyanagi]